MRAIIGKQFPDVLIPLIDNAKSSISIIVFDWRWYPNDPGSAVQLFNQTIARASRRGVSVRALVNNSGICATLNSIGCEAKKYTASALLHVKLMVIDEKIVVLGSHNYSQNAFSMNHELSAVLDDGYPIDEFLAYFENLWQTN